MPLTKAAERLATCFLLPLTFLVNQASATTYSVTTNSFAAGTAQEALIRQDFTFSVTAPSVLTFISTFQTVGQSCIGTGTCTGAMDGTMALDLSSVFSSATTYFEQIGDGYSLGAGGEIHHRTDYINCNGVSIAAGTPCSVNLSPGQHTLHFVLEDQLGSGLSSSPSSYTDTLTTVVTSADVNIPEPSTWGLIIFAGGISLVCKPLSRRLPMKRFRD